MLGKIHFSLFVYLVHVLIISFNVSPIPSSERDLMFADFESEKLFQCRGEGRIDSLKCYDKPLSHVEWHYEKIGGAKTTGWKYRGGSAGKKIANNTYIGFGHLTDAKSKTGIHHDIFTWKIALKPDVGFDVIMSYVNVLGGEKYDHRLTDPTTLLCMNNAWYIITVESDKKWGYDQGYYQRVYRIVEDHASDHSNHTHYNAVPLR